MNVKRAPEIATPVSKSRPSAGPTSAWSRGSKSNFRGEPQRAISTLSVSSAPSGVSTAGKFGSPATNESSSAPADRSRSSNEGNVSFNCATSAFNASAVAVSPLAMAAPMALDASFLRACAFCISVRIARRFSSKARMDAATGAAPLRIKAASKSFGFSRIYFRSCMAPRYAAQAAISQ